MDTPFTPSPQDGAIELLRAVFGNVIDHVVGGGAPVANAATSNMLAEAFRYFNSGVLLFGAVVLMAITVMAVANTANDGEALGKSWSTFYTPLRTLVAASSLIPTASGYAGVQIAVFFVITYSIGFASNLWSSVVNYSVGQAVVEQAMQSIANDPNVESLTIDALRMHICAAGVNAAINATVGGPTPIQLRFQKKDLPPVSNRSYVASNLFGESLTYKSRLYFKDANWPGSENICGQIVMSTTFEAPDTTSGSTQKVAQSLEGAIANIRYKFITDLFASNGFAGAVSKAVVTASQTDDGSAVVDTQQISNQIITMKKQFMADVSAEISTQVQNENAEVAKKLSEKGWIYAGGLYMELARTKDAIRNATTTKSEYIAGTGTFDGLLTGEVAKAANGILSTFNTVSAEVARKTIEKQNAQPTESPRLPILQTNITAADFTDGGNGMRMAITSWFNQYSIGLLSGTVHYMSQPDQDPVMRVKNIGDWLSTGAVTAMTAKAGITATLTGIKEGSAAASNQPVIGVPAGILAGVVAGIAAFVQEIWSSQSISLFTVLYVGYFLGIWVPMIPYYVFTLGVVG
jgi:conjugal transfer/type IV secretion protein DotA/TraY